MSLRPTVRENYHVLLREFDWFNAPEGSDPHFWTVSDITLGGRSLLDDFRKMHSGYGAQYVSWDTINGVISWFRFKEEAMDYAESLIEKHRSYYLISA